MKTITQAKQSKVNKQIVAELEVRFVDKGELLSKKQIMAEYFGDPKSQLSKLFTERRVMSVIHSLKKKIWKDHALWLAVIEKDQANEVFLFGIARDDMQARYAMHNYYSLTKGIIKNVVKLRQHIMTEHLLTGEMHNESLMLPSVTERKRKV